MCDFCDHFGFIKTKRKPFDCTDLYITTSCLCFEGILSRKTCLFILYYYLFDKLLIFTVLI